MKVLVIPEDQTWNGYILRPLVKAIMADAGRPRARVTIAPEPRLRGYAHAVKAIREDLPGLYGFFDLWLFFPDADRASIDAMRALERNLAERDIRLLCCAAQPELEIYACVAFRSDMQETWEDARRNPRMKEEVFQPLVERHGDRRQPGESRGLMIKQSLRNLPLLLQLCPELKRLRDRIAAHLSGR